MSRTTVHPQSSQRGQPLDPRALIPEARARHRRRQMLGLLVVASIAAAVTTSVLVVATRTGPPTTTTRNVRTSLVPGSHAVSAPSLAWIDYVGHLHVGDPLSGQQRVVARALGDPTVPVVALAGRLFWVNTGCISLPVSHCPFSPESGYSPSAIKELDLRTHQVRVLGYGQAVFATAGGRAVYIERRRLDCPPSAIGTCSPKAEEVVRVPIDTGGRRRVFVVPHGWYVNAGNGFANPISVPAGIFVQSNLAGVSSAPLHFALWNPTTGHLTPIGSDWGLIDAHTYRDGATVLAWLPGTCELQQNCGLDITNLRTKRTLRVPSPLPYGFDIGGAFSPNGSQLAVFVRTNSGEVNPAMQFGLVDTKTGVLRLIPGVTGQIGESVGWAHWLPSGTDVLAGTFSSEYRTYNHYLIDTRTDAVKLVDFSTNRNLDVNFSSSTILSSG